MHAWMAVRGRLIRRDGGARSGGVASGKRAARQQFPAAALPFHDTVAAQPAATFEGFAQKHHAEFARPMKMRHNAKDRIVNFAKPHDLTNAPLKQTRIT